jgi:signal transduction histidine kinase
MAETSKSELGGRARRSGRRAGDSIGLHTGRAASIDLAACERSLAAFNAVAETLDEDLAETALLGRMCRTLAGIVDAEGCAFGLLDGEGGLWIQRDGFGFEDSDIAHRRISCPPDGGGFAEAVAYRDVAFRVSAEDPRVSEQHPVLAMFQARSLLAVPWRAGSERLGVLVVCDSTAGDGFRDTDAAVLRIAAGAAGLVWRQHRTAAERVEARAFAEGARVAKSQFLSRMSHELRTPLVAVLGFAEILQLADLPPQYQEAADTILRSGGRLLSVVENLLDVSRPEVVTPPVPVEPVEVARLVHEALEPLRPLAAARDIQLKAETGAMPTGRVLTDPASTRNALVSIFAHVIKLGEAGNRVTVTVTERADTHVRISITVSGAGMTELDRNRLFDPFESVAAKPIGIDGAIAGLALPRRLIEVVGGSVGFSNVVGSGTTLWVALPQAESSSDPWRRNSTN